MKIGLAKIEEVEIITDIYNKATIKLIDKDIFQWKYPFHINEIKNEILLKNYFVVRNNQEIIACFGLVELENDFDEWKFPNNNKTNIYLYKLVVDPKWQGKGIFSFILKFIKMLSKKINANIFLTCYSSIDKTNLLYQQSGFRIYDTLIDRKSHDSLKDFFKFNVYLLN